MSAKYETNLKELFSRVLAVTDEKEKFKKMSQTFAALSKKIFQLIAKSWPLNDPEGVEIKKVLLEGNSQKIKTVFKKHGVDLDESVKPYTVLCNVEWNTFFGSLQEIASGNQLPICNLPYPPRPMEVTEEQLTEWVDNNDPDTVYPPYAYIPLSSGC